MAGLSLNLLLAALALAAALLLLGRRIRDNRVWRATVTPLASIIGSGFLVVVPLLGHSVSSYAPLAMLGIVVLAYGLGAAIRFNILRTERMLAASSDATLLRLETVADLCLVAAYFVSVTFYLRLLASFALRGIAWPTAGVEAQILATGLLAVIGLSGWTGGLAVLERLEEYSVSIKLAIIAALLFGWAVYDTSHLQATGLPSGPASSSGWETLRILAGVLIVVQGFETSRYLGGEYDRETRVHTMKLAQWISGGIYVGFVTLSVPTLGLLPVRADETAVIDLSRAVAAILPGMLVLAAVMSQFSAAVADTIGAGGLIEERARHRLFSARTGYALVGVVGITLIWIANVFRIITIASQAFALYYGVQCLISARAAQLTSQGAERWWRVAGFAALAILMAAVVVLARPAE